MSFINLDAANYEGHPVAAGKVFQAEAWSQTGHVENIQTTDTPVLLWDHKTNYTFLTAAQSLEILSSNVNDTSAGFGARTVLVETLDASYNRQFQTVTLNGTSVVALSGTHFRINAMTVLTVGSGLTNAGDITLRVAGGGAVQGFILTGVGMMRAARYTVPNGKRLVIDNFYINANNATSGSIKVAQLDLIFKLGTQTEVVKQRDYFLSDTPPTAIPLHTGVVADMGVSIISKITGVSANGVNLAASFSGILVPYP